MTEAAPAWRTAPERGNRTALRLMGWLAPRTPDRVARAAIWLISLYFTIFPGRDQKAALARYLGRVLGRTPGFMDHWRHLHVFSHVVFERAQLLISGTEGFTVTATGQRTVSRLHAQGRCGVLLGAHIGSFEALRAFDRTLPGLSVRYLMFEDHAGQTAEALASLNPHIAEQVIPVADGQGAMLAVAEALGAGHFVAFLGDRNPDPSPRGQIRVDFLGHGIDVPRAPYLSAMLAGVPLILCFAPRIGHRHYEVSFREIHDGTSVPRCDRDAVCRSLAQTYADALGTLCRRHPHNWFNFFDIWDGR